MKKKRLAVLAVGIGILLLALLWFGLPRDFQPDQLDSVAKSSADYELDVQMSETGQFAITAIIEVTNDTEDEWPDIGFYFVPNAMNADETAGYTGDPVWTEISSVTVEQQPADFQLANNELLIELEQPLRPESTTRVEVVYGLDVPEEGLRLSQVEGNFYLAHWYPMLAPYDDDWQIHDYDPKGESYWTGFGSYTIHYELPEEYWIASSAQDGAVEAHRSGTLTGENIKDFYLALLDPAQWKAEEREVNDTALRVFVPSDSVILNDTAELAAESYAFFEKMVGKHTQGELDIIANDGYMEYPNSIEVASDPGNLEYILVHEIAHQWFYLAVGNDPFREAWLDESLTEFSTALFLSDYDGDADSGFQSAEEYAASGTPEQYANIPLDEFEDSDYYATVYGKVPLLLKDFFEDKGGNKAALEFLSAYYHQFQFEQATTDEFRLFFDEYFKGNQQPFLDSWLK